MKRLMTIGAVLTIVSCGSDFDATLVDGNIYLIAYDDKTRMRGLSEFDKNPQGKYAGMIFVFPDEKERVFHTRGFKHYVMLCNFEGREKRNCACMKPNSKVKIAGRVFLEELYDDEGCTKKVYF